MLTLVCAMLVLATGCSSRPTAAASAREGTPPPSSTTPTPATTAGTLSPSNIPSLPGPGSWAAEITNPWCPLIPGAKRVFHKVTDGEVTIRTIVVAQDKKIILGVPVTVVHDTVETKGGGLLEDAEDWYAQDVDGAVWHFGGITQGYEEDGKIVKSKERSWRAGADGAIAGVFMPSRPAVGYRQFQGYRKGQVEDQFAVVSIDATVSAGPHPYEHAVMTEESTVLEPGVVTHRYFVRGVGEVYVVDARDGGDFSWLRYERNPLLTSPRRF
jgi:hypothetical protein